MGVGVAPQEQVCYERVAEEEAGHLGVRLIVQKKIQRVVYGFFLAVRLDPVEGERKRHRLGEYSNAGIHGRHLHGGAFRHGFPDVLPPR